MITKITESVHYLADLTSAGTNAETAVLPFLGAGLIILIGGRLLTSFASQKYGEMVSLIVAAIVCGFFILDPAGSLNFIKGLTSEIFGSG